MLLFLVGAVLVGTDPPCSACRADITTGTVVMTLARTRTNRFHFLQLREIMTHERTILFPYSAAGEAAVQRAATAGDRPYLVIAQIMWLQNGGSCELFVSWASPPTDWKQEIGRKLRNTVHRCSEAREDRISHTPAVVSRSLLLCPYKKRDGEMCSLFVLTARRQEERRRGGAAFISTGPVDLNQEHPVWGDAYNSCWWFYYSEIQECVSLLYSMCRGVGRDCTYFCEQSARRDLHCPGIEQPCSSLHVRRGTRVFLFHANEHVTHCEFASLPNLCSGERAAIQFESALEKGNELVVM